MCGTDTEGCARLFRMLRLSVINRVGTIQHMVIIRLAQLTLLAVTLYQLSLQNLCANCTHAWVPRNRCIVLYFLRLVFCAWKDLFNGCQTG